MAKRYNEMTASERLAAYNAQIEAIEIHIMGFANRPGSGSRADREAWNHKERCKREAEFIRRVARSCGDTWATKAA